MQLVICIYRQHLFSLQKAAKHRELLFCLPFGQCEFIKSMCEVICHIFFFPIFVSLVQRHKKAFFSLPVRFFCFLFLQERMSTLEILLILSYYALRRPGLHPWHSQMESYNTAGGYHRPLKLSFLMGMFVLTFYILEAAACCVLTSSSPPEFFQENGINITLCVHNSSFHNIINRTFYFQKLRNRMELYSSLLPQQSQAGRSHFLIDGPHSNMCCVNET